MSKNALIDEAFTLYANTNNPLERQRAFSVLVTLKALPKFAADSRLAQGIAQWGLVLASDQTDTPDNATHEEETRLLAIAELVRTMQVLRSGEVVEQINTLLQVGLQQPLPPSRLLKEADDRLNLARACAQCHGDWLPNYVAQAVADEEMGEKARAEFLAVLFQQAESLSHIFTLLAAAFANLRFATETPSESMAKRLVRTLIVFRPALLASLLPAGENTGQAFANCLRAALNNAGQPKEQKTKIDLTREVALTLHDILRTRFSLATEAASFAVLQHCRRFFPEICWPQALQECMGFLVQDVVEALLLLGRQDIPQQALLEQLELVCGIKDKARAVAQQLAAQHHELPERIRNWLRRGRLVQQHGSSEALQTSLLEMNDLAVGCALLEARKLSQAEVDFDYLTAIIEIYEPSLLNKATSYLQQVKTTLSALEEVAARRGITLLGREGERLEFTPKFFEPLHVLKTMEVTVRRPAILRQVGEHNTLYVLMKGLVE